jgi:hypothetical protein
MAGSLQRMKHCGACNIAEQGSLMQEYVLLFPEEPGQVLGKFQLPSMSFFENRCRNSSDPVSKVLITRFQDLGSGVHLCSLFLFSISRLRNLVDVTW